MWYLEVSNGDNCMASSEAYLLMSPGLRRFEGTYSLYEGVLFRFKYEKGNLRQGQAEARASFCVRIHAR
jgi:hypothetical protein